MFVYELDVWILDELLIGFDLKFVYILKEMMREYVDKGKIVFFFIYVLEVVEKLCDCVVIINKGNF